MSLIGRRITLLLWMPSQPRECTTCRHCNLQHFSMQRQRGLAVSSPARCNLWSGRARPCVDACCAALHGGVTRCIQQVRAGMIVAVNCLRIQQRDSMQFGLWLCWHTHFCSNGYRCNYLVCSICQCCNHIILPPSLQAISQAPAAQCLSIWFMEVYGYITAVPQRCHRWLHCDLSATLFHIACQPSASGATPSHVMRGSSTFVNVRDAAALPLHWSATLHLWPSLLQELRALQLSSPRCASELVDPPQQPARRAAARCHR